MSKLLVIAADYPFPPRYGFAVRVADMCRALTADWEQHLLVFREPSPATAELAEAKCFASVRFVDPALVTPPVGWAARVRRRLRPPHFDAPCYAPKGLLAAVEAAQQQEQFDVCMVHTPLMAGCFKALPPSVIKVLDAHDLWYEKHGLFCRLGRGGILAHFRDRERELAAYRAADLTLAISLHDEAEMVRQGIPPGRVLHVPVSFLPRPVTERVEDPVLLYTGGHGVFNLDAIQYFVKHVLPRVRLQVPRARLAVLGAKDHLRACYADHPHVELLPPLADVHDAYRRAQLVVVPLRHGTGLKIKVLEAFAHRMPAILSATATQGLRLDDYPQRDFSIAPERFAAEVVKALCSPTYRDALANAGHAAVLRHYQPDQVYGPLRTKLLELVGNPALAH